MSAGQAWPARALVAEDEPLLRAELARQLHEVWPELEIVAQARNGREAVEQFEVLRPSICFLDVHMPGVSGIEAARQIGERAHLVFVTAYDHYAIEAFAQGVLDYVVKPVSIDRLAATVRRLQGRLAAAQPVAHAAPLLDQLAALLRRPASAASLRWLRATVGTRLQMIAVEDIRYLRAEDKYTRVAWRGEAAGAPAALVRTPLRELLAQLDATQFLQVHRSVVVNLAAVLHLVRLDNETARIHLRDGDEVLPVSRNFIHQFRQM
jgi:DNA-binding LytR/AlgR family response regulator